MKNNLPYPTNKEFANVFNLWLEVNLNENEISLYL